jgi:glucose/arabinose dehydrogenase/mono/diheme cytochrome c family protein
MRSRFPLACLALILAPLARAALPTPDPDDGAILLPPGFRALVVADNLTHGRKIGRNTDSLRFLAIAPNGDIYAKNKYSGLFALRDTKGDGRVDVIKEFGISETRSSDGPLTSAGTCIALHDGWLYYSTRTGVYRYKYTPGELVPSGEPQTIVSGLPAEKDHDAKCFAFDDEGRLLVEVGSPYNVYSQPDRQFGAKGMDATEFMQTHAGFWRFDPNKLNQTQADGYHFSTGHRHSLALVWNPTSKNFFMVMMGRDNLSTIDPTDYDALDNAERVAEEMHVLREGINLGWPYTYYDPIKKAHMVAPEFGGDNRKRDTSGKYDDPVIAFPAHWAPLQMALYTGTQFPAHYRGGMFLAFHGSWNRAPQPQGGYKVVFIPFDEKGLPTGGYETFADGFAGKENFVNSSEARFRPCGVAIGPDGSLYIGDTEKGRIWRVIYTGEINPNARRALSPSTAEPTLSSLGGRLYQQICAACHMPDGNGVSGMQPPLNGSAVVAGDPTTLIRVVLQGPAQVLPADRAKYANQMPPFAAVLSDTDIATILTQIRRDFGKGASPITPEQVAAQRAK